MAGQIRVCLKNEDRMRMLRPLANDFALFAEHSFRCLGFEIAEVQREMATFMSSGEERLCLMAARGFSKTYLVSLYACWRWLRNPHLKIKVMSNSHRRAVEITSQILHFIHRLPYTKHLRPKSRRVSRTSFNIHGALVEKESSLQSISVGSNQTGSRIDLLIADDVESEHTLDEAARTTVLNSLREASSMLHPPTSRPFYKRFKGNLPKPERTVLVALGTYATRDSLYIPPADGSPHFLKGAVIRKWSALKDDGTSRFPERFTTEYLTGLRDRYLDHAYWTLQFMLDPEAIKTDVSPFKLDLMRSYALPAQTLTNMTAYIDPSAGGTDWTVCVVGGNLAGKLYIHDIVAFKGETSGVMLGKVADVLASHKTVRNVTIENNSGAYPELLQKILLDKSLPIKVLEHKNTQNKLRRVLENAEPPLNSGECVFNARVLEDSRLVQEMGAWRYDSLPSSSQNDDFMDAIASWIYLNKRLMGRKPAIIGDVCIA